MPRYDLNIAIFDTIRYIMPSLRKSISKMARCSQERLCWHGPDCTWCDPSCPRQRWLETIHSQAAVAYPCRRIAKALSQSQKSHFWYTNDQNSVDMITDMMTKHPSSSSARHTSLTISWHENLANTRLPSNLRRMGHECMYLARNGNFQSSHMTKMVVTSFVSP